MLFFVMLLGFFSALQPGNCQSTKSAAQVDWDKIVDAARKEGKVTVSISASAELRKQLAAALLK